MRWDWLGDNVDVIVGLLGEHLYLALLPVVLGLAIALPLGFVVMRYPRLYPPMLTTSGILYSIPSLALFIVLPGILGTRILDPLNVVVALTVYTVALLVRTVVDGLRSVPDHVRQAATALGFKRYRQLLQVELPIALPVIMAGVRVATVANISLASVGALIGVGGLGELFTNGFQRDFLTPILVGVVLSVALALLADSMLVLTQRALTPWARAGRAG
jgi:osmoprotectant transport system permease protein